MNHLKKLLRVFARFILRFPVSVFFISCLLAGFSVYFATQIQLNSSLRALLPKDHSVLKVLDEAKEVFDHKDLVIILVRSQSKEKGEAFVRESAEALRKHPEFKEVDHRLPIDFFQKNILLYLDHEDIKKIYQRLKNKIEYEKRKGRMGLFLDDLAGEDPGFSYEDILEKYKKKINFDLNDPKTGFFYKETKETNGKAGGGNHIFMIMAKPKKAALDISYSSEIISTASGIMNKHREKFPEIQSVEFTGRYQKKPESLQSLIDNFKKVTLISLIGILIVLFLFFRSARPILLLFVGLSYGILLTLGITQVFVGSLNLISTFLIAILLGLGIDFGVHIILRYKEERDAGKSVDEAFILMYTETCSASIVAALTTSAAFSSLIYSNFVGFSDFGFIGCVGVLCILFSYMTLVPSLILIITRRLNIRIILAQASFSLPDKLWKNTRALASVCTIMTIVSVIAAMYLEFNYDFSRLLGDKNLPSYVLNREVKELFGQGIDVPSLIIAKNQEEEKKILRYLNERKKGEKEKQPINLTLGLSSFVPDDQNKKLISIQKIQALINANKKYLDQITQEHSQYTTHLKDQLNPDTFTENELPEYIKNNFQTKDPNETKRMILAYSDTKGEDGLEIIKFANYIGDLKVDSKPLKVASDRLIFAEILRLIRHEGKGILIFSFLAILLMVSANMKSFYKGILVLLPVILGLLWMIGLQAILGVQSDFVNIITYLVVLGTSIDASIHLYSRFIESGDIFASIQNTGKAISVSSLTTLVGFGALLFATNESIMGLGLLAVIGIGTNYLACMLVLPTAIQLIERKKLLKTAKNKKK